MDYDELQKIAECRAEAHQPLGRKPPLGLMPKSIWEDKRRQEIRAAIQRFLNAGKSIPSEWLEELGELTVRYSWRCGGTLDCFDTGSMEKDRFGAWVLYDDVREILGG